MSDKINIIQDNDFAFFLEQHHNEIINLYKCKYHQNGNFSGIIDAVSEIQIRYGVNFGVHDIEIIKKYLL